MVTAIRQARTPRMPLKLSLKPGEKFVLNGAVLANGKAVWNASHYSIKAGAVADAVEANR